MPSNRYFMPGRKIPSPPTRSQVSGTIAEKFAKNPVDDYK
jgi:hypothetical protein